MTDLTDTIVAIASPAGIGAVALLRISGPEAWTVARRAFPAKSPFTSRRAHYGNVTDAAGCIIDNVLLTPFTGPASYTGEHVVEIGCHGGILVTRQVLARLMECGARAAEPGEFTQRAWLNGKMDLTQAEAVMDVISAQTDLALRAAQRQLEGRLGSAITALRDDLLELLAHVEACIDFPEEDISPETGNHLIARTMDLETRIAVLLATASHGRILREGVRTVIAGPPNAGKSSLLNLLLGCERAIVSATPGTTRDTIEEVINLRGLPLRLIDTAGLRESTDAIEQEGVARSRHQIDTADLVLEVVDASAPRTERIMLPADNPAKHILILHKSDLPLHPSWSDTLGITVSSLQKTGLDALSDHISATLTETAGGIGNTETAVSARHESLLQRASSSLSAARARMATATAPEFTALDLHEALEALGEVVGRTNSEDLLAVIFSRFCIGK